MKREQLRILRENVILVMRDYNHIISNLQPRERALFRERIRSLDKKLQPGFTKLTWESDGVLEYFVVECRAHAYKVLSLINNYKVITQTCTVRVHWLLTCTCVHVYVLVYVQCTLYACKLQYSSTLINF